ncbi:hypothetical protein HKX48_004290 [Thoreauomyces humboldtii]|nr:hypothetical protein HKX48_004290 [Thoreauomyces humboldtii]
MAMNLLARAAFAASRRSTVPIGASASALTSARHYGYNPDNRVPAEPVKGVAAEIWSTKQKGGALPPPSVPAQDPEAFLQHPLYTPAAKVQTGLGPVVAPLVWPEYDQRTPSSESSGLPSPPNWHDAGFDVAATAPIGDYPHVRPQFAQLRDPFKYWDQQGRRNYGEIMYDHDNFTEIFSIGPEVHWWQPAKHSLQFLAVVAGMAACVHWWDVEEHLWFAEKDYPYDGLRVELGGDPNDETDTYTRAALYKI